MIYVIAVIDANLSRRTSESDSGGVFCRVCGKRAELVMLPVQDTRPQQTPGTAELFCYQCLALSGMRAMSTIIDSEQEE